MASNKKTVNKPSSPVLAGTELLGIKVFVMKKNKKIIRVRPTCEYPCQWDDLVDSRKKVIATIYTLEEGKRTT